MNIDQTTPGSWRIYEGSSEKTCVWMWLRSHQESGNQDWELKGCLRVYSGAVHIKSKSVKKIQIKAMEDKEYRVYVRKKEGQIIEIIIKL